MTSALRWGWVVSTTPRPFYPRKRPGTHCTGGWVAPRTGLDGCGKSRPPPGLDPRTVQPVVSLYTDWAIPAPGNVIMLAIFRSRREVPWTGCRRWRLPIPFLLLCFSPAPFGLSDSLNQWFLSCGPRTIGGLINWIGGKNYLFFH